MSDSYTGYRLLLRVVGFLVLCLLLGLLLGEPTLVMLIGSLWLVFWNYRQLARLNYWLWQDKRLTPPNSRDSWEGTFNGIYRLQKKNRKRMSQLVFLLGRFRQGAEALPDAAVVLDTDHTIIWCNKLAQQLLGLAITKHALSHHQSELNIVSELGQGSTFSFVIPANLINYQC